MIFINNFLKKRRLQAAVLILTVIFSIALQYYSTSCGLLQTPDSKYYLTAAENLNLHGKIIVSTETPYLYWPPLFPVILSFLENPVNDLRFVNSIVIIALAYLIYLLSLKLLEQRIMRIGFILISLSGVHTVMISVFLWSELICLLLLMLNFYLVLHRPKDGFLYILLSAVLLCLQRNAGLFYVAAISLWLSMDVSAPLIKRWMRGGILFVVCFGSLFSWYSYVAIVQADPGVQSHIFFQDISHNSMMVLKSLSKVFFPGPTWLSITLFLISLSLLVILYIKNNVTLR